MAIQLQGDSFIFMVCALNALSCINGLDRGALTSLVGAPFSLS